MNAPATPGASSAWDTTGGSGPPIFAQLAAYASTLDARTLDEATLRRVDWVVMDLLASTFAGLEGPNARALWRYAAASAGGAVGACQLWGAGHTAPADVAAMVNGANGYEAEFDDGNTLGGHWGSSCIPAILALAEREGGGADDVIAAVVAAYEVGDRVSHAFSRKLLEAGVHFPGTMGAFGAVAGAARMLRLSARQTADALGMCSLVPVAPYYPGLVGSASKAMYSGWPNRCGVQFAELAAQGFGGPADLLEGRQGLAHVWGWDADAPALARAVLDGLGADLAIHRTYFKPYPCCRWLHPVIQAVHDIVARHAIAATDVRRIDVAAPKFVGDLYMVRGPFATSTQAKYSLPYCAAVAAFDAQVGQRAFDAARLADARACALSDAVDFAVDDALERAFPASFAVRVTVTTHDGRTLTSRQLPRWSAQEPATFDELAAKFMGIMQPLCPPGVAQRWLGYFRAGLRADPSMQGFFTLMRHSRIAGST